MRVRRLGPFGLALPLALALGAAGRLPPPTCAVVASSSPGGRPLLQRPPSSPDKAASARLRPAADINVTHARFSMRPPTPRTLMTKLPASFSSPQDTPPSIPMATTTLLLAALVIKKRVSGEGLGPTWSATGREEREWGGVEREREIVQKKERERESVCE